MAKKNATELILRLVLGLMMLVFGLNGFFQFISMGDAPEGAMALMGAMIASGYLFTLVKGLEVVIGLLLLSNQYVRLANIMAVPLTINFVLFHIFLAPAGSIFAIIAFAINVYLIYAYWDSYKAIVKQ